MPLYVGDYLGDTGHLTTTEHGAYMLLLMVMWRSGGKLPNDPKRLARFSRCTSAQWARMEPTIMALFTVSDAEIFHKRLSAELTKYTYSVERQRVRSSNGGKAKSLKTKKPTLPTASFRQCQPEPEPDSKNRLLRSHILTTRDSDPDRPLSGPSEPPPEAAVIPFNESHEERKALADQARAAMGIRVKRTGDRAGAFLALREEGPASVLALVAEAVEAADSKINRLTKPSKGRDE